MRGLSWSALLALSTLAHGAEAEWLTLGSRAISRPDSADPDAPVTSYGYGPRARGSLGVDLALLKLPNKSRELRVGFTALVATEDAHSHDPWPNELGRSLLALSVSWAYRDLFPAALPAGHELELGVEVGDRSAFAFDQLVLDDAYHTDDVPFGAGGTYLGVDAGLRSPLGARVVATSRLTLRAYLNAFPDVVGQTEASDHVASGLEEGAELSGSIELGARLLLLPGAQPVVRLFADLIEPHDDSAKLLWLTRALIGVALPGAHFELEPYADVEAGHGQGLLVNRSELRLGVGARIYAR